MSSAYRTLIGLVAALTAGLVLPAARAQTAVPTVELPSGGLIFAARSKLVVEQETLTIGIDRVEIDYTIRNNERDPRSTAMAFPLPVIDLGSLFGSEVAIPAFDPANPTNFVAFWTTIDDLPVEPEVDVRAFALGHIDITAELTRLGLPLYPFAPELGEKLAELSVEQKQSLVAANILDVEDQTYEPLWALRNTFHWRHAFAPDKATEVRHHYRPVLGSAPWSAALAATAKSKFCMSDADIAALDQRASDGKAPTVYWLHYTPGLNAWLKGPSSLFKLVIEKPQATSIAATCLAQVLPIDATRLGFTTTSRTDDSEIEVMFVE